MGTLVSLAIDLEMLAGGSVAAFAAHIDLAEGGCVAERFAIVVLLQVGAVAIGAHAIPSLRASGPMQGIIGGETFGNIRWVEMEPLLCLRIPTPTKYLEAA